MTPETIRAYIRSGIASDRSCLIHLVTTRVAKRWWVTSWPSILVMGTKQSTATEPTTTPTAGPTVTEQRASPAPLGDRYTSPPPSSNLSLYSRDNDQYSQQPRIVAIMPQSLPQEETHPRPRYVDVDFLLAELQRMPPLPPPRSPTSSSTRDNQRRERRSHHQHHRHHHHHHRRHGEGINPLSIPQATSPRLAFLPDLASEFYKMSDGVWDFYYIS